MGKFSKYRVDFIFKLVDLVFLALAIISLGTMLFRIKNISIVSAQVPISGTDSNTYSVFLPTLLRNAAPICSDEFNQTTLQPCWYWVNEDHSTWNLTEQPGYLQIISDSEAIGAQNLLLQKPPAGSYEIRTRLVFTPTNNYQLAGIVAYSDENNFMAFGRAFCDADPPTCVGNGVYFDLIEQGQFVGSNFASPTLSDGEIYLRVDRQENNFHAFSSEDGSSWMHIGTHTPGFDVMGIGLTAAQDYDSIGIPANFDYYHVTNAQLPADIIFYNGELLTMDEDSPQASALALRQGVIQAVGDDSIVSWMAGDQTTIIDLENRTLMPGFVDAHTHLYTNADFWGLDLEEIQDLALENGITTIANLYTTADFLTAMQNLENTGKLRTRTSLYLSYTTSCGELLGDWYQLYQPTDIPGELLRIAGVKIFTDGGSCGYPAYSYDHPIFGYGDLWFNQAEMDAMLAEVDSLGYQAAIHALGDRAVEQALNAIEFTIGDGTNDLRHRIEHNAVVRDDLLSRYSEIGVVPLIFGAYPCGITSAPPAEYADWEWRWQDLLSMNPDLRFVYHSDTHAVGPVSPLENLYSMVTGYEISKDGVTVCETPAFLTAKQLAVGDVLPMMTINGAYALFRDDEIGSLEPNKYADLIILSGNPLTVPVENIKDLQVLVTMVGGKVEHCAPGQDALCP